MVGPDYVRPRRPTPAAYKEGEGWKVAQPGDDAAARARGGRSSAIPSSTRSEAQVDVSNQTSGRARRACARRSAGDAARARCAVSLDRRQRRAVRNRSQRNTQRPLARNSSYNVALGASWELDLWGRIRRSVEAAGAGAQASAADLAAARLSVQATLAQNYFLLRVQDAQIALLRDTVAGYERSLQLTRNQYAAGIVARGDVAQAEAQLKSTQAQVLDAKLSRAQLEHAIAVLVGKPPSELSIAPRPIVTAVYPDIPLAVPSELLERRPDIAAAERRTASANAQIGVAQAAFFPRITLSASGGLQSSVIGSLISLPSRYWALGAALAQASSTRACAARRRSRRSPSYDETVATYRQTVLTGFQEVEDNLAALSLLAQEAAVQDEAVAAARRVRDHRA